MSRIIKQIQFNTQPVVINSLRMVVPETDRRSLPESKHEALAKEIHAKAEAKAFAEVKAEAEAKAEAKAAAKIEEFITQAQREMEEEAAKLYEEARTTGHAAGLEQGRKEGYETGFAQGKTEAEAAMAASVNDAAETASRTLSAANVQAKQTVLSSECQILEIALAAAEKILSYEIITNSEAVVYIVKQAMEKVRNQEQISVRINPADFEAVVGAKRELEAIMQREQSVEIVADQTISRGGCIIDSAFGSADARIETQLQAIQSAVRGLLA